MFLKSGGSGRLPPVPPLALREGAGGLRLLGRGAPLGGDVAVRRPGLGQLHGQLLLGLLQGHGYYGLIRAP